MSLDRLQSENQFPVRWLLPTELFMFREREKKTKNKKEKITSQLHKGRLSRRPSNTENQPNAPADHYWDICIHFTLTQALISREVQQALAESIQR